MRRFRWPTRPSPASRCPPSSACIRSPARPIVAAGDRQARSPRPTLTGPIAPGQGSATVNLDEARRRLARSTAWDGVNNVAAAYGHFIDDENPAGFIGVLADQGLQGDGRSPAIM